MAGFICLTTQATAQTDWNADIDFLKNELPYLHTNLFHTLPRNQYEQHLENLRTLNDHITDEAMTIKLQQLICRLGDSHTAITYQDKLDKLVLPFFVYYYKEGPVITSEFDDHEALLGNKLISINGHSAGEIADSLRTLIVADNENRLKYRLPYLMRSVALLRHFGFVRDDKKIEVETENLYGIRTTVRLKPKVINDLKNEDMDYVRFAKKKDKRPYSARNFSHTYKPETGTLYILYNRAVSRETGSLCNPMDSVMKLDKCFRPMDDNSQSLPSFKPFADSVLHVINNRPVTKIVVDLSKNTGGSTMMGSLLIHSIARLIKNKPETKVIGVIGRRTFSAGIIHALELKRLLNATLIGETAGGLVNFYGGTEVRYLPGSCMPISYSRGYRRNVLDESKSGNQLIPDILLTESFVDVVSGTDPVYEWIKNN